MSDLEAIRSRRVTSLAWTPRGTAPPRAGSPTSLARSSSPSAFRLRSAGEELRRSLRGVPPLQSESQMLHPIQSFDGLICLPAGSRTRYVCVSDVPTMRASVENVNGLKREVFHNRWVG